MVTNRSIPIVAIHFLITVGVMGHARETTVTFDVDAHGDAIEPARVFDESIPLSTEYSSLGVTFGGVGKNNGGSIADDDDWHLLSAASGANFLAFNRLGSVNALGGSPVGPEILLFSPPISNAAILAHGIRDIVPVGPEVGVFVMEAYRGDMLVDTDTATHERATLEGFSYASLGVFSDQGIDRIVLSEVSGVHAWVFDDLVFTPIPEPSTFSLGSFAVLGALIFRKNASPALEYASVWRGEGPTGRVGYSVEQDMK